MANNWKYMKAADSISGIAGALYATIDGNRVQVAECKSINAKITKNKVEFKSLGQPAVQYKAKGWTGSGTLVIHYCTSRWAQMMIDYAHSNKDKYFTLDVINEDPTNVEKLGRQHILLEDVNLDESEIAKLDVSADFLDQSMNFTFSGVQLPEKFRELN